MRKKGENSVKCAGKSAIPPDKTMISHLISKVHPSNFADFAALRAAVLWWKVLNPLYNPARLPPTWPAPASAMLWLGSERSDLPAGFSPRSWEGKGGVATQNENDKEI